MAHLNEYMNDGANWQAKAVLAALQRHECIVEESYVSGQGYQAKFSVGRWENCREQGYIVSMRDYFNPKMPQLNIAFFEHRNSDSICAIKWIQGSMNTLTIDTAKFGDVYKDKYDVSKSVGYGKIMEMAEWIEEQFEGHWEAHSDKS